MDKENTTEALIESAKHGSEAAFEELTKLTGGLLKKFIARRIGSHLRLDPEDVLQGTFLRRDRFFLFRAGISFYSTDRSLPPLFHSLNFARAINFL